MDYLDLAECQKNVAVVIELNGTTKEFYKAQSAYLKVRALHDSMARGSPERTIPRQLREAFAPIWKIYRTAYKQATGEDAPQLPE